jgi:hypothetical protein
MLKSANELVKQYDLTEEFPDVNYLYKERWLPSYSMGTDYRIYCLVHIIYNYYGIFVFTVRWRSWQRKGVGKLQKSVPRRKRS